MLYSRCLFDRYWELVIGLQRIDEVEEDENAVVVDDAENTEATSEAPVTSTDAEAMQNKQLKSN